jgi:hypothetical protein
MLFPRADWRDVFAYAPDGSPDGWTRERAGRSERFTSDGLRLLEPAAEGRPAQAVPVAHRLARDPEGRLEIRETDSGRF